MNTKILVGADPEAFIKTPEGTIISAIGTIGGNKENPRPVKRGAVQEDNVLAEFNIDPASSSEEFIENIQTVKEELEKIIFPNTLVFKPIHTFNMEYLFGIGSQAFVFGCDPDYNSWTLRLNNCLVDPMSNIRVAGGHVHVGFPTKKKYREDFRVACMMDLYLGLPSILYEISSQRRDWYGKAGACRPKPYGVEYRTLSNFWLDKERYMKWVFNNTVLAYKNRERLEDIIKTINVQTIIGYINGQFRNDFILNSAKDICNRLDIPLVGEE